MRVPIDWLKEFVKINVPPEALAKKLTLAGLEAIVAEDAKVIAVDILPNRGDCESILGAAREVSAILKTRLIKKPFRVVESKEKIKLTVEVKEKKLCPRYMARVIGGVVVADSPEWLKKRLLLAGIRPVNNIVDITNYLLIELGQPMHAFDAEKISKIIVRQAKHGEKIITLDGLERILDEESLLISDPLKPIAIAGIMGGLDSSVMPGTKKIILESAFFEPASIVKSSKKIKLRTEASMRFEKRVDFDMVEEALDRAAALISGIAGGVVLKGKIDVKAKPQKNKTIALRNERIKNILGVNINRKESAAILKLLGFKIKKETKDKIIVEVPSWRAGDVEREIDLIEEIARIYGFDKINETMPEIKAKTFESSHNRIRKVREILLGCGLFEVQTFSMVAPLMAEAGAINISNPMAQEESVMRTSLIYSLLRVLSHNLRHQASKVNIFEVGKVYSTEKIPDEKNVLSGLIAGGDADFYKLKGMVESLLQEFTHDYKLESYIGKHFHPGKSASIIAQLKIIGKFGAIHPDLFKNIEVYAFEIDLDRLLALNKPNKFYKPLPKYPKVERDLAMFVPQGVASQIILETIKRGDLVESVEIFDIYKNSQAYRISFRDKNKTLTDEEVSVSFENIQKELENSLKVQIRK
ncbi:MAG: phenylalanyl-tRNA synthetase beta chain [Candidatus Saganbacteria bacterium]|uniref:Phenylalanine--tRNA ligase beta subunit n=1 Tax=Candidatus Saganbacteria bacterium TaxID=2575572 RepID=A0A833L563_UNCSA|nr:MAG: phenylalanyl-tRNA synthetase beta chain [Candidatus Saganbacteria bacterium]